MTEPSRAEAPGGSAALTATATATATAAATATATAAPVPMSALRRGALGRVARLDPALPAAVRRRLIDLGFAAGVDVRCLRRAPLGSPVVYRVGETELCLRRGLSDRVLVETVG